MGLSMGGGGDIGGTDLGDSFMDAPRLSGKSKDGKSDGWNPVSAFLDAVGIHIGGRGIPPANGNTAVAGTDPAATPQKPAVPPVDSNGQPAAGVIQPPSITPISSDLAGMGQTKGIIVPSSQSVDPGQAEIDGKPKKDGAGSFFKTLLKAFAG